MASSKVHEGATEVLLLYKYYMRGSLFDRISWLKKEGDMMTEGEVLHYFLGILKGVEVFHRREDPYCHRDLKPHNVMLDDPMSDEAFSFYHPLLTDLGSAMPARVIVSSRKDALAIQEDAHEHVTAAYRPPELWNVAAETVLSEKVDIWALGCVLYELAFLQPLMDESEEHTSELQSHSFISYAVFCLKKKNCNYSF
eukprot:TRINITY_DN17853_c0_g1_i1.p1 TRINITY_DN17853_c0_g1~~TRINITY_DN17853_c0_g1_i1.p1  ORF type:complete len:215 (+),score=20.08 TRINITY_DN17853_c0_g1_i1:55-645(+)